MRRTTRGRDGFNPLMNRRDALKACAHAGLLCICGQASASAQPPRVVFLNPGEAVERGTGQHWQLASRYMNIAAKTFGMRLEVHYAERDHLLLQRQAEEIAQRRDAPDYVVIVNEKMAAKQMLETLSRSSAKVLLIHNDLTAEQRREIGNERQQVANWIGTITANAAQGAYRLTEYLCQKLARKTICMIGITGDPKTPVSLERASGVEAYLSQVPDARICQLVFSDWSFADSNQKARVLLARYPDANVIWAANDSMTLGALEAVRSRNAKLLVGGVGALREALSRVEDGEIAAMVGGDYFIGAWAMVLLHDYHHGKDFALANSARLKLDFLRVIDHSDVRQYYDAVFTRADSLDFGQYSKVLHPRPGGYDFDMTRLLDSHSKVS